VLGLIQHGTSNFFFIYLLVDCVVVFDEGQMDNTNYQKMSFLQNTEVLLITKTNNTLGLTAVDKQKQN